jgi:Raf kinase inhibitor-like YbhB/YbcL family protein
MALTISSPAFSSSGPIPREHGCEGADRSPPLAWEGVPEGARSLALIVDDPDAPDPQAPKRTWVHWVVVDLPADVGGLREDASRDGLPDGAREGRNDWGEVGWRGPCPPVGRHRYFFKLYALDRVLPALVEPTKAELERAMAGHVLAQAELVGTYEKGASRRGRTAAA